MTRPRLIDVARDPRPHVETSNCTDVVHVPRDRCPDCDEPLHDIEWTQPAIFYFGGHGAATTTTIRRCSACRWTSAADEASVNPRRLTP